jgi:hypothetical protein
LYEAVDTFNDGKPISSINSCGRIVEGIAKTNFPNVGADKVEELILELFPQEP